jgi:serine/threonine protein kinase
MSLELDETATAEPARPPRRELGLTETLASGTAPRSSSEALAPGRQLAHYRIERLLGAGGMGEVYLATDLALDRPVALKVVAHGTATAARRERLIREARAQARIQHPNVCHIYYIGESDGLLFFAMELVTGKTFSERIAAGPVPPEEAVELIRMASLGLREATRCGFTHRDVKPSNLMIDQHGAVKVMDFGLVAGSTSSADDEPRGNTVEQTSMAGTPLYMAPEQARGEPIDFRADIYALGATLYHLVAGKPPFAGETLAELLRHHSSTELPRLVRSDVAARTLAPVGELCARMMAKDPAARPGSYDDLLRELELLSPVRSRPAGATVRLTAASIDGMLLLPVVIGTSLLYQHFTGQDLDGLYPFSLAFFLYRVIALTWLGRSVGHAVLELEVVSTRDGRRPPRRQVLRRMLWQLGPLVVIPLLLFFVDGHSLLAKLAKGFEGAMCLSFFAALYYASFRRARRRTYWDRWSDTMVRYRPR